MKQIFPAALIFVILFFSCSKENNTGMPLTGNMVKTYTEWDSFPGDVPTLVTYNLSYDNNDRLITLTSTTSGGDRTVFAYPSANHVSRDIYTSNVLRWHDDYYTNSNGLVDSVYSYVISWPIEFGTYDTIIIKYNYNTESQLVGYKRFRYSYINGIVQQGTVSTVYNADGYLIHNEDQAKTTFDLEYYTDSNVVIPVVSGLPGVSKPKKNYLLKKETLSDNGVPFGTVEHTYTFDSRNRVISEKGDGNPAGMTIKTYTYF